MRAFISILVVSLSLFGCAATDTQQKIFPMTEIDLFPERLQLNVPQGPFITWKTGELTFKDLSHFTTEAVPFGEDLIQWSKMVVLDYWSAYQHPQSAAYHADNLKADILKRCPQAQFQFDKKTDAEVYYHWSVTGCKDIKNQVEMGRFLRSNNGTHRVAFIQEGDEIAEDQKKFWQKVFETAQVQDIRKGRAPQLAQGQPYWVRAQVNKRKRLQERLKKLQQQQSLNASQNKQQQQ